MEVSNLALPQSVPPNVSLNISTKSQIREIDLKILDATFKEAKGKKKEDPSSSLSPSGALNLSADQIVARLNEILNEKYAVKIEDLNPDDYTPEKTAERIFNGVVGLFAAFSKQNSNLEPEELLNKFMTEVRKGVDAGYSDAVSILENLGAFRFDGVKDSIAKTKELLDEKLNSFEEYKLKELKPSTSGEEN